VNAVAPPQALESAERVLGALLLAGESAGDRTLKRVRKTGLEPHHFYFRERHGFVYEAVLALAGRGAPTDHTAVGSELERRGRLDAVGGREALFLLVADTHVVGNAAHHARLVIEAAQARDGWRSAASASPLDAIVAFVRRFVVVTFEQADAIALWVMHTHVFERFDCSPYLAASSAEKRSGKSRLLAVLELLVARPWSVVRPSEAVAYRKIARDRPTLLLDETDTIFGRGSEHEGLRALLNAGNQSGVVVPRCAGPQRDRLEEFEVYCPKALAGIGRLPDTVEDRAVPIKLKRRTRREQIERFRRRDVTPEAAELRDVARTWAESIASALEHARPDLPERLDDRAADAWEPLLAIADLAGGDWPKRARRAALVLSADEVRDEDSDRVQLLADIRRALDLDGGDRLSTAALLATLTGDEEAPWATYGRGDKPLGAHALAGLLRPFGIRSRTVRLEDGTTPKGFKREQFEDAWERYAPASGASETQHRRNPHDERDFAAFQSATSGGAKTGANPHGSEEVAVWRSETQLGGSDGEDAAPEPDPEELQAELERMRSKVKDDAAEEAAERRNG
jgi:Protein of unknown function (DUF3631)/DnaB-like helicase N terminal domain